MLTIEKERAFNWRIKPLADDKGELIRESKPFRSDGKTREYIVCELIGKAEKDEDNDIILGEMHETRVVKSVWVNQHAITFNMVADLIEQKSMDKDGVIVGAKIKAAVYKLPCGPHRIYDKDGAQIMKADGQPAVGRHVRFVLFANEQSTVEQEYKLATADLDYFTAVDDVDRKDEIKHEPKIDPVPPVNSGERSRR